MPGVTYLEAPDKGVAVPWSQDVASAILAKYAAGMPLYRIAALEGFPCVVTMYAWKQERPEWSIALAHARTARAERTADEGLALIDGCDGDSSSQVGKAREQGAYRRWLAGCLDPTTYGDKAGVQVNVLTVVNLASILPPRPQQPDREVT